MSAPSVGSAWSETQLLQVVFNLQRKASRSAANNRRIRAIVLDSRAARGGRQRIDR